MDGEPQNRQMQRKRAVRRLVFCVLFAISAAISQAQSPNSEVLTGSRRYQEYCAACHGSDGRGGDKAASLMTSDAVRNRTEAELFRIVHDGSPNGMPPFAQIGDANIAAIVHYLRLLANSSSPPDTATAPATQGDAQAGRALYFGKAQCAACHMVRGQGGFAARDLTAYAQNRAADTVRRAIADPGDETAPVVRFASATTKDGRTLTGLVRNRDAFTLTLQTGDGRFHFLDRNHLMAVQDAGRLLMPRDYASLLTRRELNDLVSFLMASDKGPENETSQTQPEVAQDNGQGEIDVKPGDLVASPAGDNWASYNGDYTGRRFSRLAQITPENAHGLIAQWVFHVREVSPLEVTPIVVAGVMFVTSANDAYALDARTGKALWHHARSLSQGLVDDAAMHHNRGVAVLGSRVYVETDNAHLLCLDARSGGLVWEVAYATGNRNYGATSAPLIVKNMVMVGVSGGDDGARGFLAAFDAQTGKERWRFWTIPAPGEKGAESWPGDQYLHGGGATWMPGTYDPELNTLYWGTGNPSPDYDGSVRPGDDLYTSCLLALDPDTGKLKWHFQFSPHDLYDYDAVQTPVLVDADFKGRQTKLAVTANRNGFLYILDRTNGKFLFAKQFALRQTWAKGIDASGRPIPAGLIPDRKGVVVCPANGGGTNWYSPSYNPGTRMFYFRAYEACATVTANSEPFEEGRTYYSTGMRETADRGTGYVNAFDLSTLDFAWRNEQIGSHKGWGGIMSTATGLVAYGDDGENFVVLDGRSGKALWHFNLGQQVHASPMSYAIDGKQYFAVAAGSDVFAFALP